MKKRDHSASPSTGQRPRFRQCLTPHLRATRLQLMVTVWKSSFPYLGSLIHCTGGGTPEIKRRVSITRDCMMVLDRNIWRSCISVGTKLCLYNSCILPIFLYGAGLGPWQQRLRRHSTLLINGFYAASWIYTGQNASPTRSDHEPNSHYCLTHSAPDAFASLVTSAKLTPVRIILGHCTPVLLVCPSTGGEDLAGQDRPGYEILRTIYGHSIWVWRQLNNVLRTEQLGRHSWKWLRHWQAPDDDEVKYACFSKVWVLGYSVPRIISFQRLNRRQFFWDTVQFLCTELKVYTQREHAALLA